MLNWMTSTNRILLCTAVAGAFTLQAASAWAAKDAQLTSVKGAASVSSGALASHSEVGDDETLRTGNESGCSILLDQNSVVELCGQTRISFATDARRGNRIVNVEAGTLRMFVEPRKIGERIEIHTPAAIATILGTIIYVTVDPATGASTFTSSDSQVNIRDRNEKDCVPVGLPPEAGTPECDKGTTIGSLEQLTVVPGERRHKKVKVSEQQLAELGGCLLDFHDLAAATDRLTLEAKAADDLSLADVAGLDLLPPVSLGNESTSNEMQPDEDVDVELDPFDDPSQEEEVRKMLEMEIPVPCDSFPGEQCNY
jgi:hypothetical protein